MITVIAAVLERDGRVLACRRRADQSHALKWEFPGGKVEPGEEPLDALRRELLEELGVQVQGAREITRYVFQYPEGPALLLIFYQVDRFGGAVENRIFQEIRWAKPADLPAFDFLEGDLDFIRCLADGKLSGP